MPIYKINNDLIPHQQYKHYKHGIFTSDSNLNISHNEIQNTKNNDSNGLKTEKVIYHDVPLDMSLDKNCHLLGLKRNTARIRSSEETIVESEIRRQLEKEKEIQSLHSFGGSRTTPDDENGHVQNNLSHVHANTIGTYHATREFQNDFVDTSKRSQSPSYPVSQAVDIKYRGHKKSNVHPFEDDDDDEMESKLMFIQPQSETVLEKEIRLTRQRESSLRRARGYPLKVHTNEREVEVPVLSLDQHPGRYNIVRENVRHSTADSNDTSKEYNAKRLATNRLKQEIYKERQREVDLMKQGKIKTLSEERVAIDASIIEELVAKELEERKRLSNKKNGFSSDHLLYPTEKIVAKSPDRLKPITPYDQKAGKNNSSYLATENHKSSLQEKIKFNDTYTSAEARIEEEIREINRREAELREQRVHMGLSPNTTSSTASRNSNTQLPYKR